MSGQQEKVGIETDYFLCQKMKKKHHWYNIAFAVDKSLILFKTGLKYTSNIHS